MHRTPIGRQQETDAAERAIVALLADAVGVAPWRDLVGPDLAAAARTSGVEDDELAVVHSGTQPWMTAYPDGRRRAGGQVPAAFGAGVVQSLA